MNDQTIEQEIQEKGLTAPRVTPSGIDAVIEGEYYFTAAEGVIAHSNLNDDEPSASIIPPLQLLTFCVLVLKNGFTVTGESACASPENFNEGIGRKIALENAKQKIWALEGYLLKQKLSEK